MTYVAALVALLILLAGVIAYAGDRLGTWVGRRRLTLFGARPKRTGQIVGVAAGILIMLTTLAVLAVAFRSAADTLLNAQRTAEQLAALQAQERALQSELAGLTAQQAALEADLRAARDTIAQAEAARDAALEDRDRLRGEAAETQAQLLELAEALGVARADLDEVDAALAVARLERDAAVAEAAAARATVLELEREVADAEAALADADVRLLELDVQLSEADAAWVAANELRVAAEAAAAQAFAEAAAAATARAAAEADLAAAEAGLVAAEADRAAAVAARAEVLAQVDELTARIDDLMRQGQSLAAEAAELEALAARRAAEAEAARIENVGLQARNDQLAASNAELLGRSVALQELNVSLQAQILAGNEEVRALQDQVRGLSDLLEDQARRLAEAQLEFSRATSGEVTFARDQVVYSGALYARDAVEAREELAAFVRAASDHTARLGAGEVVLSAEQFAGLVEVIAETEGSDLVRLISPRNQFNPARVEVVVEALENTRLVDGGQLLMSRRIHVGTPDLPATQEEVRGWIAQFRADVIRSLRRAGLDELQAPVFVGSSDEGFANQLMRLSGPVTIGVVAREAIDRAGPAYVEMVILF